MILWLPAAIAAAGQIGGSLLGAGAARKNVSKSNRAQRELAAYSFNRQVEMWNMQNKYNSPKAQMQRFKEAGLNPHLIYGQGTPGNANQMPVYQTPQQDYRGRPSLAGSALEEFTGAAANFLSIKQAQADVDLTRQRIQTEQATTTINRFRADGILQENAIRAIEATIAQYIINNHKDGLSSIAKGRIGAMEADNWLRIATSQIRQWEKTLTDNNVNPRDTLMWRQIFDFLELIGFSPSQIKKQLGQ